MSRCGALARIETLTALALLVAAPTGCSAAPHRSAATPAARPAAATAAVAAGRVDSFSVALAELGGRRRTVRVYLPPGYERGDARFPVLYLQDAQQLFSPGPLGDWKVDETMDRLAADGRFGGLVVVGVDNGARSRWDEYGPSANAHVRDWIDSSWARATEGGQGDAYIGSLVNSVKPQIDRRYRTRPGRAYTGIGGSSMGGLLALHAGLSRPDVFSKVMAMSTAVWFAEDGGRWLSANRLVAEIRARPAPRDVRYYLDVGTNERSRDRDPDVVDEAGRPVLYPRAYVEGTRAAADALTASGVPDSNVKLVVEEGAVHHESAWSRRLEGAVRWLYR